jgi:hypothetical protein
MSETRLLPVKLSPEELRERANELADKVRKWEALERLRKETAKAQKVQIDGIKENVLELSSIVSQKSELRPVEVIESFDVPERLAREVRTDTGETVGSRPMTLAEVQEHEQKRLQFADGPGEEKPKKRAKPEAASA